MHVVDKMHIMFWGYSTAPPNKERADSGIDQNSKYYVIVIKCGELLKQEL